MIDETDCKVTKMQSEQKVHVSLQVRHLNSTESMHITQFTFYEGFLYDIKKFKFFFVDICIQFRTSKTLEKLSKLSFCWKKTFSFEVAKIKGNFSGKKV